MIPREEEASYEITGGLVVDRERLGGGVDGPGSR
jgi:hypothetical protein